MSGPENVASICCDGASRRFWAKDLKVGFANINAKAEGIETRPAFCEAFQRRRCLVPNELCAALHNRMPVVLKPQGWPIWLGEEPATALELKAVLAPFSSEEMTCWPVSARMGNVKNNDASLIEPIVARADTQRGENRAIELSTQLNANQR